MLFSALIDILFPRACACCGREVGQETLYLCWDCLARISVIHPPFCYICGDPVEGAVENHFVCSSCTRNKPFFDIARSAVRYMGTLQPLIQDFKYHGATWLNHDLVSLMLTCVNIHDLLSDVDVVTYVPLYPAKERERSYNQARLLAGGLKAARIRKPLYHNILYRKRLTMSQTHLTASARIANVNHVFSVRKAARLKGKCVLLMDDVMTTGATVNECSRVLKQAGAEKVVVLTLARG